MLHLLSEDVFGFENFGGKENDEKRKNGTNNNTDDANKHISLFEYKVPNGGRDFSATTIRAFTKKSSKSSSSSSSSSSV